jgi:hypothetical protein
MSSIKNKKSNITHLTQEIKDGFTDRDEEFGVIIV